MTHLSKPSLYLVALVAIGCLFYACSDEELSDVSAPVQEADFTVRVKNGYLEFKDQAAFDEVKASLEGKDREALDAWESQFEGFTSLRSIDEKSIDAQQAWFEQLQNMKKDERTMLSRSDENFWYSNYVKEHASSFVLEDSGRYRLNITGNGSQIVSILNQDGVYKIGNDIYMLRDNATKIIHDGDDRKIALLSDIEKTDEGLGVSVFNNIVKPIRNSEDNSRQTIVIEGGQNTTCDHKAGRNYVTGEAYIEAVPIPNSGGLFLTALYIEATNYYKDGLFGGYTRKRTRSLRINGNVALSVNSVFQGDADVDVTTNGRLDARINTYVELRQIIGAGGTFDPLIDGSITIFGRGGTSCGDNAPSRRRWVR